MKRKGDHSLLSCRMRALWNGEKQERKRELLGRASQSHTITCQNVGRGQAFTQTKSEKVNLSIWSNISVTTLNSIYPSLFGRQGIHWLHLLDNCKQTFSCATFSAVLLSRYLPTSALRGIEKSPILLTVLCFYLLSRLVHLIDFWRRSDIYFPPGSSSALAEPSGHNEVVG